MEKCCMMMMMDRPDKEHEEWEEAGSTCDERFVILRLESTDGWRRVTNADDPVDREGCTVMRSHR